MASSNGDGKPLEITPMRLVIRFCIAFGSSVGAVFLVMEIIDWILDIKLLSKSGPLGALVLVLMCALMAAVYTAAYAYRELASALKKSSDPNDLQLTDSLMANIQSAFDDERWEEVLRIGSVLSRPLWVSGKLRLRVKVGKMVEKAALLRKNYEQQAIALIDDRGWTNVALNELDEAKKNILHGMAIAEKHGYYHLICKAHRHMLGLALEKGNVDEATTHLKKAQEWIPRVVDERTRSELTAGLHYAKADIHIRTRRWEEARAELEIAQDMYRNLGDRDREAKLYFLRGQVLEHLGDKKLALDVFREGVASAKQLARPHEMMENAIGAAQICEGEGDWAEAKRLYLLAASVASELGREDKAKELKQRARNLRSER